jgi:uncharacterized protein (TIGR02246 family)
MYRKAKCVFVATLFYGCTPAAQTPSTDQWNEVATQEARTQVEGVMRAFVSMDVERFAAGLMEDVVAFEFDLDNNPVRLLSRSEVVAWANSAFADLGKINASLTLDLHAISCHATSALAYCTAEFDLNATMADGIEMTQPTRNSVVLRNGSEGWKWAHWHSSLAVGPSAAKPPVNAEELIDFASRYTAAWNSRNAASVAEFFAEDGALSVNGSLAEGRTAVTAVAQGFMTAFPDMKLSMDSLDVRKDAVVYHWTFVGTHTGTGNAVNFSGYEEWTFGDDGLVSKSMGHFDNDEYQYQLEHGVGADPR